MLACIVVGHGHKLTVWSLLQVQLHLAVPKPRQPILSKEFERHRVKCDKQANEPIVYCECLKQMLVTNSQIDCQ
jgi:hypothetical protein